MKCQGQSLQLSRCVSISPVTWISMDLCEEIRQGTESKTVTGVNKVPDKKSDSCM